MSDIREALVALLWDAPWLSHQDCVRLADAILSKFDVTPRGEGEQPGCTGAGDCPAAAHTHGCYADTEGHCEHPEEHGWTPPTVKPSVEDVARLIAQRWNMSPRNKDVLDDARAVLALLPGRSEAEVKAEALDEAAYAAVTDEEGIAWDDDYDRATVGAWLGERAEQARGESRNG